MSITLASKTTTLAFASRAWATQFSGTQLDAAITACLTDLADMALLRSMVSNLPLAAGGSSIPWPTSYRSLIAIQLTDAAGNVYEPLAELPGDVLAYRRLQRSTGRPRVFVDDPGSGVFLLYPTADAPYTVQIDYWWNHPPTPDTISLPVRFQHLLDLGTVYWEAVLRRNAEYINHWGPLYYAERTKVENQMVPIMRN